jgi:hypothetical protein
MSSHSFSCELPESRYDMRVLISRISRLCRLMTIMTMLAEQITRLDVPLANKCQRLKEVPDGTVR